MQLNYQPCDIVQRAVPLKTRRSVVDFDIDKFAALHMNPEVFHIKARETDDPFVQLVLIGDRLELRDKRAGEWIVRWRAIRNKNGLYVTEADLNGLWLSDETEQYSVRRLYNLAMTANYEPKKPSSEEAHARKILVSDGENADQIMKDFQRYESYRNCRKASRGRVSSETRPFA